MAVGATLGFRLQGSDGVQRCNPKIGFQLDTSSLVMLIV